MEIITGGQSGADLSGNFFALKHNIPTEINAFKDFKPIRDELPANIKINYVCDAGNYTANLMCRTRYNVKNSDFTVVLLDEDIMFTKGSKATVNFCSQLHKSYLYINIYSHIGNFWNKSRPSWNTVIRTPEQTKEIIKSINPQILNIAGQRDLNREHVIRCLEMILL